MKTVFVSGSRQISRLNQEIRGRLQNIIDKGFQVVVGDANGADKALQTFFADPYYTHVLVFCSGTSCRNNVGPWDVVSVAVDPALTGRAFYTQKDKAMAQKADYGLVLWDGKSVGSVRNIFELASQGKPVLVYFSPTKEFIDIRHIQEAQQLLGKCEQNDVSVFSKKAGIARFLSPSGRNRQIALPL